MKKGVLIILVVGLIALSMSIRMQPLEYGWELDGMDSFYNYRVLNYLEENGLQSYLEWQDDKVWYPEGRNISATSQVAFHVLSALIYQPFGDAPRASKNLLDFSTYEFAIIFPVVMGGATTAVMYGIGSKLRDWRAGLFCAFFFAVSVPILVRGMAGWFRSEPFGLFLGLLALFLFISAVRNNNDGLIETWRNQSWLKLLAGGIVMAFAVSAWGGALFFIIPILIFMLSEGIRRKKHTSLYVYFTGIAVAVSSVFERSTLQWEDFGGLGLLFGTAVSCMFVRVSRKVSIVFIVVIVALIAILFILFYGTEFGTEHGLNTRYVNAVLPSFDRNPIVASISEHTHNNLMNVFSHTIFLLPLAVIGAIYAIKKRDSMAGLALAFGVVGVFVGLNYVRLEMFLSIGVILLGSIAFVEIINSKKVKPVIFIILLVVITFPAALNWSEMVVNPPSIMNGGAPTVSPGNDDWVKAMKWVELNTPEDAVIAAWWDYGYWITGLSERTTLQDGAANRPDRMKDVAEAFTSEKSVGIEKLRELGANYLIVNTVATKDSDGYWQVIGGDIMKRQWHYEYQGLEEPTEYGVSLIDQLTPFEYGDDKWTLKSKGSLILDHGAVYISPSFDAYEDTKIVAIVIYDIGGV